MERGWTKGSLADDIAVRKKRLLSLLKTTNVWHFRDCGRLDAD